MKLCQSRKPSGTNDSHAASATAAPTTNHLASGLGSWTAEANSGAAWVISSHVMGWGGSKLGYSEPIPMKSTQPLTLSRKQRGAALLRDMRLPSPPASA